MYTVFHIFVRTMLFSFAVLCDSCARSFACLTQPAVFSTQRRLVCPMLLGCETMISAYSSRWEARKQNRVAVLISWLLLLLLVGTTTSARGFAAFSTTTILLSRCSGPTCQRDAIGRGIRPGFISALRGGDQTPQYGAAASELDETAPDVSKSNDDDVASSSSVPNARSAGAAATAVFAAVPSKAGAVLATIAKEYGVLLRKSPILTKSLTAGVTFALSDFLAQRIETTPASKEDTLKSPVKKRATMNWKRLFAATVIGFCYFGPAAHYWYDIIFKILPGTTLVSTLQKAALGQLIFGPTFTCVFFASSLLQAGKFSFRSWADKIKTDLPGAWLAGVGYWPLVDLISYGFVPVDFIPLFVNGASLLWTIYLSLVANR